MESTGEGERLPVAVLGATGQLGARVAAHLRHRGVDVVEVSRWQGADACSGEGLDAAFDGVTTVVDCLHLATLSRERAVDFSTTASNVLAADEAAEFVADRALEPGGTATPDDAVIAGPEVRDMAELARAITQRRGGRRRVLRVPVSFTALGDGGLLPRGDFTTAPTRFEGWLRAGS